MKLTESSFKNFIQNFVEVVSKIASRLVRPITLNAHRQVSSLEQEESTVVNSLLNLSSEPEL